MKKPKGYYYEFWLTSSRGTDEVQIRVFKAPQKYKDLQEALEGWIARFGAVVASENYMHYGWRELKGKHLPKNRKQALKRYAKTCKVYNKAWNARRRAMKLLEVYPYNGAKN